MIWLFGLLLMSASTGIDVQTAAAEDEIELKFATGASEMAPVLGDIFAEYHKEHPRVSVTITVIPGGVTGFNSTMASKLAAGDAPDIFQYQWGTLINAYARGRNLLDITDIGVSDVLPKIRVPFHKFEGREYAYPVEQSLWGVMYNRQAAQEAGVAKTPKTYRDFIQAMERVRESGIEYPFIIPAKDASGASGFIFCYLNQVLSVREPDFYYQCCSGEKSWDSEEWRELFALYQEILNYAEPDSLQMGVDQALGKFAGGEGVCMIGFQGYIKQIEKLNPELTGQIEYIPFPFYEREEDCRTAADFDSCLSIWSGTRYPQEAMDVYRYLFRPENNVRIAQARNSIPIVKGTGQETADASIQEQLIYLEEGRYSAFASREWIAGMKEAMKTIVQKWIGGEELDVTLRSLQETHRQLLQADPEFLPYLKALHGQE